MSAQDTLLGSGLPDGEQLLPDLDEFDEFNDETFGVAESSDWEIEQLAEQTAALEAGSDHLHTGHNLLRDASGEQQELWVQAMLEASVNHLLDDEDDDFMRRPLPHDAQAPAPGALPYPSTLAPERPTSNSAKNRLNQLFDPNLTQHRLFDVSAADAVWGPSVAADKSLKSLDSTLDGSEPSSNSSNEAPTDNGQQHLMALLTQMQNKHQEDGQKQIKGAMTAEELEKQLLNNNQTQQRAVPEPSAPRLPPSGPMTVEELERRMRSSGTTAQMPPPPLAMPPPRIPPPGVPWPPGGLPLPPPPFQAPNPAAMRAAILSCLASGRPLPPALAAQVIKMPFLFPRGLPPRFRGPMPRGPVPPGMEGHYMRRQHVLVRAPYDPRTVQRRQYDSSADDFSTLMSKREREWLVKIQALQLQGTGNPYCDDYYWTMFRNKQYAKHRKQQGRDMTAEETELMDTEHSDPTSTPYVYVPPTFEGSLGKPTLVSANFPRQLIDLASANGHSDESSPASSTTPTNLERPVRRFKTWLLEVENLWTLLLECEDKNRQMLVAPEEGKSVLLAEVHVRISFLSEHVVGARLPVILSLRKGRALLGRLVRLFDKEQATATIRAVASNMATIAKKDHNNEALDSLFPAIFEAAKRLSKDQLSSIVSALSQAALFQALGTNNRFNYYFLLLLFCHCSRKRVTPQDPNVLHWWVGVALECEVPSPDWLASDHVDTLCEWLLSLDLERDTVARFGLALTGS